MKTEKKTNKKKKQKKQKNHTKQNKTKQKINERERVGEKIYPPSPPHFSK